ncbi:hypothetical protein [Barnesiella viscericola]|uniref:hypothetical protein n=1 Tax=Barnesiella viscericola TaxID=397865 RepID=UPI003207F5E6
MKTYLNVLFVVPSQRQRSLVRLFGPDLSEPSGSAVAAKLRLFIERTNFHVEITKNKLGLLVFSDSLAYEMFFINFVPTDFFNAYYGEQRDRSEMVCYSGDI